VEACGAEELSTAAEETEEYVVTPPENAAVGESVSIVVWIE
jgi:hypothetical protein